MTTQVEEALNNLSPIQRDAVNWNEGAVLVLAGPGAGKTRVLTTRIARLLEVSAGSKFKILALTFTTKAAAEMHDRVQLLIGGQVEERTFIGTFHAFCAQLLRQHGSHVGIKPDFAIYGQRAEQEELLADAIRNAIQSGEDFSTDDVRWLDAINAMKSRLITPEKAPKRIRDPKMPRVYALYEAALHAENAMDFSGLIMETCRLLSKMPAIAERIRKTYRYWLIDEFQDTTPAQYWLLHYLSGEHFQNIFAVADDDQIIYQWAGASYRQIEKYRERYKPALIQLVENHRCPPEIVGIANQLVANNTERAPEKKPVIAARTQPLGVISVSEFETDEAERAAVTEAILAKDDSVRGETAVLARTRALLEPTLGALQARGIKARLLRRRDNFLSPQFVWLQACLDQALRPSNRRVFATMVNAANRVAEIELDPLVLMAEAEGAGHSYFEHWAITAAECQSPVAKKMGELVQQLAQSRNRWKEIVREAIPVLLETAEVAEGAVSDAADDHKAWMACVKEIRAEKGDDPDLPEVSQGLALRSKEPPRDPNSVALLTIHASKGLEFDFVYVIGLAEQELPSWQSLKKGDHSFEMEEERRNCFVAITRTREGLTLSYAKNYRGYSRKPSRFLQEMGLI